MLFQWFPRLYEERFLVTFGLQNGIRSAFVGLGCVSGRFAFLDLESGLGIH